MSRTSPRLPLLARLAALGAFGAAVEVPVLDGGQNGTAFIACLAILAAGLALSGRLPRKHSRGADVIRLSLLFAGLAVIAVIGTGARELFPEGDPLSSKPLLVLLWLMLLSAAFMFLPDGPMAGFFMAGSLMAASAYVDYGRTGFGTITIFAFCTILYGLASGLPATPDKDCSLKHAPQLIELSVVLTGITAIASVGVFLFSPLLLPEAQVKELMSGLEAKVMNHFLGPPQKPKPKGADKEQSAPPQFHFAKIQDESDLVGFDDQGRIDAATGEVPEEVDLFRLRTSTRGRWRLRAFRRFDGRVWYPDETGSRMAGDLRPSRPRDLFLPGKVKRIKQELEVVGWTGTRLPGLYPVASIAGSGAVVMVGTDWSLELNRPARLGETFTLVSAPGVSPREESLRTPPKEYLQLPPAVSPQVRRVAARLRLSARNPREIALGVVDYLQKQCSYSWTYGAVGNRDVVTHFLFQEKKGNCTSFASASTLLLRLQGVPARFVSGFMNGEPDGKGRLTLTSRHGHAWTEAWLGDGSWTVVDAIPSSFDASALAARQAGESDQGPVTGESPTQDDAPEAASEGDQAGADSQIEESSPSGSETGVSGEGASGPGSGGDFTSTAEEEASEEGSSPDSNAGEGGVSGPGGESAGSAEADSVAGGESTGSDGDDASGGEDESAPANMEHGVAEEADSEEDGEAGTANQSEEDATGTEENGEAAEKGDPPSNRTEAWLIGQRRQVEKLRGAAAGMLWRHRVLVLRLVVALLLLHLLTRPWVRRWFDRLARRLGLRRESFRIETAEQDYLDLLARKGLPREPWETLFEFLSRLEFAGKAPPSLAPLIRLTVRMRYSPDTGGTGDLIQAQQLQSALERELS